MNIEEIPFAQTALGRRVVEVVRSVKSAAIAARGAYQITRNASRGSQADLRKQAETLVSQVTRFGNQIRSAPVPPPQHNLGAWKAFNATHQTNAATLLAMRSREARYAHTTAGAGLNVPHAYASMPEITLGYIADAHRRAHRTGWVDWKADIDERYRRDDSHIKGIDRKLRAWCYKAPLRIRPRSNSPLSGLVANAVRAAIDQLDGLTSSVGELGVVACAGYSCAELAWREGTLSIPVGGGRTVRVPSEIVGSLEQVYPRNFAFDIIDDRPYLAMGPNDFVPVTEPGLQKFMFVRGPEDGPTRFRGYGWANAWLSYLGGLTLEKFGTLVEVFGLAVPYLQRSADGFLTEEEHDHAIAILERLGTAQPEIIPSRYGELKHSPVPSGLAPIHSSMLGFLKTEQSKLVLGSTLAVEIGSNVGSYAAAQTHADGLVDTQRIYARLIAEALRSQVVRWLLEVNASRWAEAFSCHVPGGCGPEDISAELPIVEWILSDETPAQRLSLYQGVKGLGYSLDEEQVRAELGVLAPMPGVPMPGVPEPVPTEPAPNDPAAELTPTPTAPAETQP